MKMAVAGGSIWVSPCIKNVREASSPTNPDITPMMTPMSKEPLAIADKEAIIVMWCVTGTFVPMHRSINDAAEIPNPTKAAAGK